MEITSLAGGFLGVLPFSPNFWPCFAVAPTDDSRNQIGRAPLKTIAPGLLRPEVTATLGESWRPARTTGGGLRDGTPSHRHSNAPTLQHSSFPNEGKTNWKLNTQFIAFARALVTEQQRRTNNPLQSTVRPASGSVPRHIPFRSFPRDLHWEKLGLQKENILTGNEFQDISLKWSPWWPTKVKLFNAQLSSISIYFRTVRQ